MSVFSNFLSFCLFVNFENIFWVIWHETDQFHNKQRVKTQIYFQVQYACNFLRSVKIKAHLLRRNFNEGIVVVE